MQLKQMWMMGSAVAIIALIVLWYGGGNPAKPADVKPAVTEDSGRDEAQISYEKTDEQNKGASVESVQSNDEISPENPVIAYRKAGRYSIKLQKEHSGTYRKQDGMVNIYGQIDGNRFVLRVPKKAVIESDGSETLEITDTVTGVTKTILAGSVLGQINTDSGSTQRTTLDIDFNNADNYKVKRKNALLPPT